MKKAEDKPQEKVRERETYTKKELAALYELSPRAFFTMFKPFEEIVGKKEGRYYSRLQVVIIFEKLGRPSCLLRDEYDPKEKAA
jgi:hypothetical protein